MKICLLHINSMIIMLELDCIIQGLSSQVDYPSIIETLHIDCNSKSVLNAKIKTALKLDHV